MPESTARGIRYPLGVESPDWPGDFDRMADDIDSILPRIEVGRERITPVANNPTSQRVNFTPGLFDEPPEILASPATTVPGNVVDLVSYANPSTTGTDL